MSPHVTEFLKHLEVARAASKHTLKAYAQDLSTFEKWLEPQGLSLLEVSHLHLRSFLGQQSVELAAPSSHLK